MSTEKTLKNGISRRKFISSTALSGAGLMAVPRHVLGGTGYVAPSDRVNIGIVGAGGRALGITRGLVNLQDVRVTAVADPAEIWPAVEFYRGDCGRGPALALIRKLYDEKGIRNKAKGYEDFRKMLEKEKSLDAIVCGSPDNTHAYISIMAMRAGKHVYCEKPLTHNIWEARKVSTVAHETGAATQMGNQLHNHENMRTTVEYLRSGTIGTVRETHTWVPATRWLPALSGYPDESSPIPKGFNWDLWLGPTEWRPFNTAYSPVKWRDFWVFGCGALGDFGCHDMDASAWAFNLHSPSSVEVQPAGNKGSNIIAPYGEIGYYYFNDDGIQPDYKLTWYSGGLKPELPQLVPETVKLATRGALYIGDKGVLLSNGGATAIPEIFPLALRESVQLPGPNLPRIKGHDREWVDAIKGGPAPLSNFEYGAKLTELTLLGVMSLRLGGRKIQWDKQKMEVPGVPEAQNIIREPVRNGWEME